jgi:hypothetical protein
MLLVSTKTLSITRSARRVFSSFTSRPAYSYYIWPSGVNFNPLNAELNPICHLLGLLGGATIVVVSRFRVNVTIAMWLRDNRKPYLCKSWLRIVSWPINNMCHTGPGNANFCVDKQMLERVKREVIPVLDWALRHENIGLSDQIH